MPKVLRVGRVWGAPYVAPPYAVEELLQELPPAVRELSRQEIIREFHLPEGCRRDLLTLLATSPTPTGREGIYVEIYETYVLPFKTLPRAQCVLRGSNGELGCRIFEEGERAKTTYLRIKGLVQNAAFQSAMRELRGGDFLIEVFCGEKVITVARV